MYNKYNKVVLLLESAKRSFANVYDDEIEDWIAPISGYESDIWMAINSLTKAVELLNKDNKE